MTTTTYDPTSTATSLARAYTDAAQTQLTAQVGAATATATALTKLQSALSAFDTALAGLSSSSATSVLANSATFSASGIGAATASASAAAGSYSFFVEQLATRSQMAYSNLGSVAAAGAGTLTVNLAGGSGFPVNLATADLDADGILAPREIATAINAAAGNDSMVTASIVTVGGVSQMVLSANDTGADNAVSLDASGVTDGSLAAALGAGTTLVAAQDAVVWLGAQGTGVRLQQASNTYNVIEGVSLSFSAAMASGAAPVTLTVATDTSATTAKMQAFVDAYNTLEGVLDTLTARANTATGAAAGAFASDPGIANLRSRMQAAVRQSVGGVALANYGVTGNRDGTLSLDAAKLSAGLAAKPDGLTALLGNTGLTTSSGVLGTLSTTMGLWTNSSTGLIKQRRDNVTSLQASLTTRQSRLDAQYSGAYSRYLAQFTTLANLQAQMAQTSSMFDALFSSSDS